MGNSINIDKNSEVFFVAEYDPYTDEYVRLTNNLNYINCEKYYNYGAKGRDFVIYIDYTAYQDSKKLSDDIKELAKWGDDLVELKNKDNRDSVWFWEGSDGK